MMRHSVFGELTSPTLFSPAKRADHLRTDRITIGVPPDRVPRRARGFGGVVGKRTALQHAIASADAGFQAQGGENRGILQAEGDVEAGGMFADDVD